MDGEPSSSLPAPGDDQASSEFAARCDAIEEAYEFMLAYAAQGLPHEQGSTSGSQIRVFLRKCEQALDGLADAAGRAVRHVDVEERAPYGAFVSVLDHDARNAGAAVRLVLAQPSIGSQLVDNLNASSHVRAVLTDLFLLDEALKR
ncbi:MAG TPA: hypothetical protein VKB50_08040 [Vicinamibacterales bacterium]|nr:hypothetical protein [Vicinamibacterales bacterium]